jgi:hypothetical protein
MTMTNETTIRTELTHYELWSADLDKMLKRELVPTMERARHQIRGQERQIKDLKDQIKQIEAVRECEKYRGDRFDNIMKEVRQFIRGTLDVRHAKIQIAFNGDVSLDDSETLTNLKGDDRLLAYILTRLSV